jgi:hypothetical protein
MINAIKTSKRSFELWMDDERDMRKGRKKVILKSHSKDSLALSAQIY